MTTAVAALACIVATSSATPSTAGAAPGAAAGAPHSTVGTPHTAAAEPTPGAYVPLTPHRLLDTRSDSVAAPAGRHAITLLVAGAGGVPASDVSAVVLTVTVPSPAANGYVTAYPAGQPMPGTSNVNFAAGSTVANSVLVRLGSGGDVTLYNGSTAPANLVVDVSGYYTGGEPTDAGAFVPVDPSRILDTRTKLGGSTPAGHGTVLLTVAGRGGVPAGAGAVVLTVTAVGATVGGAVAVGPDDGYYHYAAYSSALNAVPGRAVANLAVSSVPADGKIVLYNGSTKPVQLIADVTGYFLPGRSRVPGTLTASDPQRVADTRADAEVGYPPPGPRGVLKLRTAGRDAVPPTGVSAVLLDITVTAPQQSGYLTVYADGSARPAASNINFRAGQTVADLVVAPIGADGVIDVYNGSAGRTQVVAEVEGYYSTLPDPYTTTLPSLPSGQTQQSLSGVSCVSSTACVAVGTWSENQAPYRRGPLIETRSGSTWSQQEQSSPSAKIDRSVVDVSCSAATSCVAVGSDQWEDNDPEVDPDSLPFVDVLSGTTWTATELPVPPNSTRAGAMAELSSVSCTSATSCVAVGFSQGPSAPQMLVETYDGSTWTPTVLATGGSEGASAGLSAVSCTSATACVAVGYVRPFDGDAVAAIETFAAGTWTRDASLPAPTAKQAQEWNDVSCPAGGSCVAVSGAGFAATLAGSTWTGASMPDGMVSVSCAAVGSCTAAGSYFADFAGNSQPWLATLQDGAWAAYGVPRPVGRGQFYAVSCVTAAQCAAVGNAYAYPTGGGRPYEPALLESDLS